MKKHAAEVVCKRFDVPGFRAVIRLDIETSQPGKEPSLETHYYMSSLDPDKVSAAEFQELIQGHWEVENCLHWQKDRYFREDKHVCGSSWGKAWTILTNMALSLSKLLHRGERTLKEVREHCAANPKATAKRLGFKI